MGDLFGRTPSELSMGRATGFTPASASAGSGKDFGSLGSYMGPIAAGVGGLASLLKPQHQPMIQNSLPDPQFPAAGSLGQMTAPPLSLQQVSLPQPSAPQTPSWLATLGGKR